MFKIIVKSDDNRKIANELTEDDIGRSVRTVEKV